MATCQGLVKDTATGRWRSCKTAPGAVLGNGFCMKHQCQVVQKLLNELAEAERTLDQVQQEQVVSPEKVQMVQKQIQYLKTQLQDARNICERDPECGRNLQDVLVNLQDILQPQGRLLPPTPAVSALRGRMENMYQLGADTRGDDLEARRISMAWDLGRQQMRDNTSHISGLERQLVDTNTDAQQREQKFQQALKVLTERQQTLNQESATAQQQVAMLQQQLDACQAGKSQVGGVYSQAVDALRVKAAEYETRNKQLVADQIHINKRLESMLQEKAVIAQKIQELKDYYEAQLEEQRKQFANMSQNGMPIATQREEELERQLEELKGQKAQLIQLMEDTKVMVAGSLNHQDEAQRPRSDLARELVRMNVKLRERDQALREVQDELADKRTRLANMELQMANQIQQETDKNQQEVLKLREQVTSLNRKLVHHQQQLVDAQNESLRTRRDVELQLRQLSDRVTQKNAEIERLTQLREQERDMIRNERESMKQVHKGQQLQLNLRMSQLKETLNARYMTRARELQDQYDAVKLQIEQDRRDLETAKKHATEMQKTLSREKQNLERYRMAYEKKLADFENQKGQLQSALRQAESQAAQFNHLERDYDDRVRMLRQKIEVDRQRYQREIESLSKQLQAAKQRRGEIIGALEKCTAARESIAARVQTLTDENTRLKDVMLQMKTRMEAMRARYETQVEKIRADASRMESNLRDCGSKMKDASLVHDDVLRMKEAAMNVRRELEHKTMESRGREAALRRMLKERELSRAENARLQQALKQCAAGRKRLEGSVQMANESIREANQMQNTLTREVQKLGQDYTRALSAQEADMTREQMRAKAHQQLLEQKMNELNTRNQMLSKGNATLQQQKAMTERELVNTEVDRARQMQLLMEANRMTAQPWDYGGPVSSGLSSLQ